MNKGMRTVRKKYTVVAYAYYFLLFFDYNLVISLITSPTKKNPVLYLLFHTDSGLFHKD